MSVKIRRIDYYPDEYISGVGGLLSAVDQGVYWMVCTQVYSRGGPIDDDHVWLSRLFAGTHWRTVRASLDRLILSGKVTRIDGAEPAQITVKRCSRELQRAFKRVSDAAHNGRKGGRPAKENNDLDNGLGLIDEKLTNNYQPTTTNDKERLSKDKRAPTDKFLMHEDCQMTDAHLAASRKKGFDDEAGRRLFAEWRDYWCSRSDTTRTERGWMRSWQDNISRKSRTIVAGGPNRVRGNGAAGGKRPGPPSAVEAAMRYIDRHSADEPIQ